MTPRFHGIIPPLVTPLLDGDTLDVAGLERLIEHVIAGGVHGLFMLGTSGELAGLSGKLRREVIGRTVRQVKGRVPVVVGVTDTAVAESVELARHAAEAGADAVVVTAPYFLVPDQEELADYVRAVVGAQPLPVFLYNIPSLTKTSFEVETVLRLAEIERVVGLKDSSGTLRDLQELGRRVGRKDWSLLIGIERLLVEGVLGGLHGCVPGGANIDPRFFVELYEAAVAKDHARLSAMQGRLEKIDRIFRLGTGIASVIRGMKNTLYCMGICSQRMADPFRAHGPAELERIRGYLKGLGI
jgi:dihydrodipicolinate synthase/N-acetylneuraminate lyase